MQAGAGFIGATSVTAWLGHGALARVVSPTDFKATKLQGQQLAVTPASATITPDQALDRLMEGNQRFVQLCNKSKPIRIKTWLVFRK